MTICTLSRDDAIQVRRSAPVCIVGAGIAGLLIAVRLARSGCRVIVLESGTDTFDEQIQELNDIEDLSGTYGRAMTGRFRGFGGTSGYWGGRLVPLTAHDAEPRPYVRMPGWPFPLSELDAYRGELERIFGVDPFPYEEDLLARVDGDGLFPRGDPDLTCRWFKCPTYRRTNLGAALKPEVTRLKNLEVWLGATVCGFEVDRTGGRLSRITAKGFGDRSLTVAADDFVFAAGAIETTRLLLLLDRASGDRAFEGCDALGRYFQDHARIFAGRMNPVDPVATNRLFGYRFIGRTRRNLYFELSPAVQRAERVASAYAEVSLDLQPQSPLEIARRMFRNVQKGAWAIPTSDFHKLASQAGYLARAGYWRLVRHQLLMPPGTGLNLEICIEQVPDRQNRIVLSRECDRLGVPKARLEWRLTDADERTFRTALARISDYWNRVGFDRVCPIEWSDATQGGGSARLIDKADQRGHPSGSSRMGTDPATSVVGPDLRCHHVPNVFAASSSAFPTSGSINPTLTIMQLALRTADALLRPALAPASQKLYTVGAVPMASSAGARP